MTTERRRYFRIADRALLKYRVVPEDMLEAERTVIRAHELKSANLQSALLGIDVRLQNVLATLRGEDRLIAEALDLLNRKLTLLGRVVVLDGPGGAAPDHREHEPTEVSLSGGGIALSATAPLALNANLAIDLVLLPANHAMRAIGRVVDCRKGAPDGFAIAIEFTDMLDADRDALVQHIVRRQLMALRETREEPSGERA